MNDPKTTCWITCKSFFLYKSLKCFLGGEAIQVSYSVIIISNDRKKKPLVKAAETIIEDDYAKFR